MNDSPLKAYFTNNDLLLIRNRLYNIAYGTESSDNLLFGDCKFGLLPGPALDHLERNLMRSSPEILSEMIDGILCEIQEHKGIRPDTSFLRELSDSKTIIKYLACQTATKYSMKNVLRSRNVERYSIDFDSCSILGFKQYVMDNISPGHTSRVKGKTDLLFIGGVLYDLIREDEEAISAHPADVRITMNRRKKNLFVVGRLCERNLDSFISDIETSIKAEAAQLLRETVLLNHHGNITMSEGLLDVIRRDSYYDENHNIGFKTINNEIYLFTKAPEHILFERVNNLYFKFPPAEVGVRINLLNHNTLGADDPVVFGKYKHPALSRIGNENQHMCFTGFDRRIAANNDPQDFPVIYLQEGCKMLMKKFYSAGGSHNDLELQNDDYIRESFEQFRIAEEEVDHSKVHNKANSHQYMRQMQNA